MAGGLGGSDGPRDRELGRRARDLGGLLARYLVLEVLELADSVFGAGIAARARAWRFDPATASWAWRFEPHVCSEAT